MPVPEEKRFSESGDYREGYSNSLGVDWALWNFVLRFGVGLHKDDGIEIKNFQVIFLSPQAAKAMALLLADNVAKYESAYGKISLEANTPEMSTARSVN